MLAADKSFRDMIARMPDAVLLIDAAPKIVFANEAAEALYGYDPGEMRDLPASRIMTPATREASEENIRRILAGDSMAPALQCVERMTNRKDRGEIWVEISASPYDSAAGRMIIAVHRDITQRKADAQALRRSRAFLNDAQRVAKIGSFERDFRTGSVEWTDEFFRIWGFDDKPPHIDQETVARLVHPEDRQRFLDCFEAVIHRQPIPEPLDFRIIRPDGTQRVIHNEYAVEFDAAGKPLRVFGTAQDITERKNMEDELSLSRENLARAQHIAHLGSFYHDHRSGRHEWSEELYRIWGITRGQGFEGDARNLLRLVNPQDRRKILSIEDQIEARVPSAIAEYRIKRPDGAERFLRRETDIDFDSSGKVSRIFGAVQDVTELRHAERDLRNTAARLAAILENAFDGIVTLNESGSIESFNPAAQKIYGYHANEVLRRDLGILLAEPYRDRYTARLRQYLATGEKGFVGTRQEIEGQRRDGDGFPLELAINEVRLGDRRIFVASMRDISERRRMEQMKSEFISTVSHELRTPLTSIGASLALLAGSERDRLSDRGRHLVEIASNNSQRLVRLINDILDVEKAQSGRMTFDFVPVDMRSLLINCIEANRSYASEAGVQLVISDEAAAGDVMGDPDRLIQVFTNLVSNAVKFSPRGAAVTFGIVRHDGMLRVSVRDEGCGIPVEFRERIFERFAQANSSDSRQKGGTGLGLNIAKSIVDRHAGTISFETELNKGTVFYVDLPVAPVASDVPKEQHGVLDPPRVLLCTADVGAAAHMRTSLKQGGFEADIANRIGEAEDALMRENYDALLLDVQLPDGDGPALVQRLRALERFQDFPIIGVTLGEAERKQIDAAGTGGLEGCLYAPVDFEVLARAVEAAIGQSGSRLPKLLHIEDDPDIRELLVTALAGVARLVPAASLSAARHALKTQRFDLVVLDIGLPDGSGLDLLPLPGSNRGRMPPVVIFSAQGTEISLPLDVRAMLTKSKASVGQLVGEIRKLLNRPANASRLSSVEK